MTCACVFLLNISAQPHHNHPTRGAQPVQKVTAASVPHSLRKSLSFSLASSGLPMQPLSFKTFASPKAFQSLRLSLCLSKASPNTNTDQGKEEKLILGAQRGSRTVPVGHLCPCFRPELSWRPEVGQFHHMLSLLDISLFNVEHSNCQNASDSQTLQQQSPTQTIYAWMGLLPLANHPLQN